MDHRPLDALLLAGRDRGEDEVAQQRGLDLAILRFVVERSEDDRAGAEGELDQERRGSRLPSDCLEVAFKVSLGLGETKI